MTEPQLLRLRDLAVEFNVQIFATTHSIEMIKSFAKVISKSSKDRGAYFEFFKHRTTGEVTSNLHEANTLFFELDNKMAVRGE